MRDIEFRVWDVEDKVFCYINELIFYTGDSQSRMLDGIPKYCGTLSSISGNFYKQGKNTHPIYKHNLDLNLKRYVIQQYIGVKDKNNNKIYDGDIVKIKSYDDWDDNDGYDVFLEVAWSKISNGWRGFTKKMNRDTSSGNGMPNPIELLGNIYQNPELLGKL